MTALTSLGLQSREVSSYFLNNAAKTFLYGLKIIEIIETERIFQYKAFFHLSSNLQTSYLSTFNIIITL